MSSFDRRAKLSPGIIQSLQQASPGAQSSGNGWVRTYQDPNSGHEYVTNQNYAQSGVGDASGQDRSIMPTWGPNEVITRDMADNEYDVFDSQGNYGGTGKYDNSWKDFIGAIAFIATAYYGGGALGEWATAAQAGGAAAGGAEFGGAAAEILGADATGYTAGMGLGETAAAGSTAAGASDFGGATAEILGADTTGYQAGMGLGETAGSSTAFEEFADQALRTQDVWTEVANTPTGTSPAVTTPSATTPTAPTPNAEPTFGQQAAKFMKENRLWGPAMQMGGSIIGRYMTAKQQEEADEKARQRYAEGYRSGRGLSLFRRGRRSN